MLFLMVVDPCLHVYNPITYGTVEFPTHLGSLGRGSGGRGEAVGVSDGRLTRGLVHRERGGLLVLIVRATVE